MRLKNDNSSPKKAQIGDLVITSLELYKQNGVGGLSKNTGFQFFKYVSVNYSLIKRLLSFQNRGDLFPILDEICKEYRMAQKFTSRVTQILGSAETGVVEKDSLLNEKKFSVPDNKEVEIDISNLLRVHFGGIEYNAITGLLPYFDFVSVLGRRLIERSQSEQYEDIIASYYADKDLFSSDLFKKPDTL